MIHIPSTRANLMIEALAELDLGEEPEYIAYGKPTGAIKTEKTMTTTIINIDILKDLRARTSLSMGDCKKALVETNNNIDEAIDVLKKWGTLKSKEKASATASEGMVLASVHSPFNTGAICEVNSQTDFVSKSPEFQTFVQSFMDYLLFVNAKDTNYTEAAASQNITKLKDTLIQKTGENIVCRRHKFYGFDGNERVHQVCYNHPGNKLASIVVFEFDDLKAKTDPAIITLMEDVAMQIAASDPLVISKANLNKTHMLKQQEIFEGQLREEKKLETSWSKIIEGKFNKWYKEAVLMEQLFIKDTSKTIAKLFEDTGNKMRIIEFMRYGLGEGIEKSKEDLNEEVSKLING